MILLTAVKNLTQLWRERESTSTVAVTFRHLHYIVYICMFCWQ